ncbi:hypothetical protein BO94DRAFT_213048 [Aspergillus sclerotioniger CBS 115572]|uniref:Uncharacterized protein n=1 Tax=Aspergillus sclerotioniger CBS 115572 TaxID=1450535 RepID=A0A317X977_9EURO|nr:hypothetical protein BO94DRAFT_213048 [Aspergillus sclerotioniger CBS 115572]PWY94895.1 hypothetical protein BO94DRAFT_213048 [Aspergillus sclerotioniger CBS 115572]
MDGVAGTEVTCREAQESQAGRESVETNGGNRETEDRLTMVIENKENPAGSSSSAQSWTTSSLQQCFSLSLPAPVQIMPHWTLLEECREKGFFASSAAMTSPPMDGTAPLFPSLVSVPLHPRSRCFARRFLHVLACPRFVSPWSAPQTLIALNSSVRSLFKR